jgi:predicted alpha/beta superfamily hydrolase
MMPMRLLILATLLLGFPAIAADKLSTAGNTVTVFTPPLRLPGLQRARTLRLYLPPSYAGDRTRRYPVIYMHDGQNLFDDATAYSGEWGIDESLDALARATGFEAIVVGIDHGGERRINELSAWPHPDFGAGENDLYLADLVRVVKPFVDANWRTRPQREHTAIVGSSLGGLASHYALHRRPEVFSKAGVFSPSYWISEQVFMHTANVRLPKDARIYLTMGGKEDEQSVQQVRRMLELLRAQGLRERATLSLQAQFEHNEKAWREEFPRAVRFLFELPRAD